MIMMGKYIRQIWVNQDVKLQTGIRLAHILQLHHHSLVGEERSAQSYSRMPNFAYGTTVSLLRESGHS